LEQDFRKNLNDEKDSEESSESFSFDRRKDNYKKTSIFVNYLKDNGYSVSEGQLGLFRFTANKLTGNLDRFLNQGMGSNALALSTNINSPRASFSIKCAITACVLLSSPSHASTIQLIDANWVSPVSRYNDLKAKSLVLPPLIKV
jgi:hypothetical protein